MAGSYFSLTTTATTAATINSVALTCIQSITIGATAPNTEIECGGATSVTNIVGLPRYSITITGALGDEDDPLLTSLIPGTAGALTCDPAGTATNTIDISSTNVTVTAAPVSIPVNGFSTYSITAVMDDITYGANI